jgi:dimethylargininase
MIAAALLRAVPESFTGCVTARPAVPALDPGVARAQHVVYRAALEAGGFRTTVIPADEEHPDGSFVEDAAVVVGDRALATRPGHPSRRGEVGPVARALASMLPVEQMTAPARLDGGDVLQVGGSIFCGVGTRTDAAGIAALERFAGRPVIGVPVTGVLHLKSAVTALDDETLLVETGLVDESAFAGFRIVTTPPEEPHGANVVRLADGTILAAAGNPRSAAAVAAAGYRVETVDISEFARADGGLTCLSVRVRDG